MSKRITEYKNKKVIDYLNESPKRVLFFFVHGLGDTLMFYPVFETLQKLYPNIEMELYTAIGQEKWFGEYNVDDYKYDYRFDITFPCSEHIRPYITKADYCCQEEIGIKIDNKNDVYEVPKVDSPFIGLHFNSACLPDILNCSEGVGKIIWDRVRSHDFIPIETHFEHQFNNPVNKKFDFVDCYVRKNKPTIKKLFGVLQACRGFIGVVSGNLHAAMGIYPERVLYLKNEFDSQCFYNNYKPRTLDLKYLNIQVLDDYLESLNK